MITDLTDITSFKWATVTGVNPLAIQLDGDTSPLAMIPDSIIDPLELIVGNRVRVELSLRKCVIHGENDGGGQSGEVMITAAATVPKGWLLANGQSLLRSSYPRLFTAIGTTYGAADGTHFTVPTLVVPGSGSAPTFVSDTDSSFSTTSTPKTATLDANAGDLIVVTGLTANTGTTLGTPTNSGTALTWTLQQSVAGVTDYCNAYVWTAIVDTNRTGMVISVGRSATVDPWGICAEVWRNHGGVGASSKTHVASGAPSLALTTTAANSAIVVANTDWVPVDGTSRTWRQVNSVTPTEDLYAYVSTKYGVYIAYTLNAGTASSKTVGLSAPTGQKYSIIALEILGLPATLQYIIKI